MTLVAEKPHAAATATTRTAQARPDARRLAAVDLARGLVVMIMALDHARHFFHATAITGNPLDPDTTTAALFATRWVTHLCAPVFVLLAGVSAYLRLRARGDRAELSRFLLGRGVWLIVLELTVVNFAVNFTIQDFGLQVIWALGVAMIALAALVWMPRNAVLALGLAVVAGHNLLDPLEPAQFGALAPLWTVAHEGGFLPGVPAMVLYPVLPWIGVMALGFGMAPLFQGSRPRRLVAIGAACLGAFAVLRGFNIYGDPQAWTARPDALRALFAFLDVEKYPPSLDYLLATLGLAMMLIPALGRLPAAVRDVLKVFGRAPLFFYLLHFYLIHGLMVVVGVARGIPAGTFVHFMSDPKRAVQAGWGFGLPVVYAVWLFVLLALYPACRWFGRVKAQRRDGWLSYL